MEEKAILSLHGFASSAQSTKSQFLRRKLKAFPQVQYLAIDFNPSPRDFEHMTTTGLVNRLRQYVLDHDLATFSIVGSSFGGLIALHYAHRFGGVEKMLLLAPSLRWLSGGLSAEGLANWKQATVVPVFHPAFEKEIPVRYGLHLDGLGYLEPIAPPTPIIIIHGRNDATVPFNDSQKYAASFPDRVHLVQVDADHDLNRHLGLIWDYVQSFLLST